MCVALPSIAVEEGPKSYLHVRRGWRTISEITVPQLFYFWPGLVWVVVVVVWAVVVVVVAAVVLVVVAVVMVCSR